VSAAATEILAGDVGGTHARLALFKPGEPKPSAIEVYSSKDFASLEEIVSKFLDAHSAKPRSATFGVAGPVDHGRTAPVNLRWPVDSATLATALGLPAGAVAVINDLEANAWGIEALGPGDFEALHEAEAAEGGAIALISAGTGLGEAFVPYGPGGPSVHASEGGHVDFAPRSDLESELRDWAARKDGHVSYEDVCSGIGLVSLYGFLRERSGEPEPEWLTKDRSHPGGEAAAISHAGLERRDPVAADALDLMVSIYGAQAGNLALTVKATGGVYLGGGIAPRILPRLREGGFVRAFLAKGRMQPLVERIPVRVILNDQTALLGAARHAERGLRDRS